MLNRPVGYIGFVLVFILSTQSCFAGLMHDSHLNWVMAESEHFRVYYHDGEKALAEESLGIAESVYTRLTPILDWHPRAKTEMVISDEMDASNGYAMPIPSNRMTIFASRPNSVNSLEDHAGWLETVILHEFVHILHLDKALGGPQKLRKILGRFLLLFPNAFMPPWMHEGLATYYETDKTLGIGRGQSSYFEMMMRMEVESGVKPLRHVNQPMVTWPLLTSRYLYGVYFYQFIVDTYGAEKIPKLVESYSNHFLPFQINTLYLRVLGKDLSALWIEYTKYLEDKFQPQLAKIVQGGVVAGKALTQSGDFKHSPLQTDDGRVLFVSDHLQSGSQLMVIQDGDVDELADLSWGASMDWHPDSDLLVSQPEICNNANQYNDLYLLDSHSGNQTRLTNCQRYIFATWSPDGLRIAAVQNMRGQHALHILNKEGVLQAVVWQGTNDETLSGIDWSADGKALASSVWRKDTGWNIEEFDMEKQTWQKRTNNTQTKTDVRYIQQSRDLIFSMEHDGVYNAFRLNKGADEVKQLTSVRGGVFSPFVTSHNQLLSVDYNSQGFDVARLAQISNVGTVKLAKNDFSTQKQVPYQPILIDDAMAYEPWDTLKPTSWLPLLLLTPDGLDASVLVSGTDVLNRHNFDVSLGLQSFFTADSVSPAVRLDYTYDRWLPLFNLHLERSKLSGLDNNNDLIVLTQKSNMEAQAIFPFLQEQYKWSVHLGLSYQTEELDWLDAIYTNTFVDYQDTVAGAALVYDARESYGRAMSDVSSGRLWSIMAESGQSLGGDYEGSVYTLSGREYFDLSNEHVLATRLDVGRGDANARPFSLGGSVYETMVPRVTNPISANAPFNKRGYSLRGYGQNETALSGTYMALASAEYRFPIARVERGWMAPPLGIHQMFGAVFMDVGRAGDANTFKDAKNYVGLGTEFGADFILFYNALLRLQIGVAKGLDDTIGGSQAYISLGSTF